MEFSYPLLVRHARIMGLVRLSVDVGPDGLVKNVRAVSGHPLLAGSAHAMAKSLQFEPLVQRGTEAGFSYVQEVDFRLEVQASLRLREPVLRRPRQECRWRDEDWVSGLGENPQALGELAHSN